METVFISYSDEQIDYNSPNYFWELKKKIYQLLDHIREERMLLIIPQGMILNISEFEKDYRISINDFDNLYDIVFDTMIMETAEGLKYVDKRTANNAINYVKQSGLLYRFITKEIFNNLQEILNIKTLTLSDNKNIAAIQALIYYGPEYFIKPEFDKVEKDQIFLAFEKYQNKYIQLIGKDDIETLANLYETARKQKNLSKWCRNNNININKILQVFSIITDLDKISIDRRELTKLGLKVKKMSDYIYIDENYNSYKIDITSMPRIEFYIPETIYAMKITNNIITIYMM